MFKSLRLNSSHLTVGVTRQLLLSSRVSSLVINLITIRERPLKNLWGEGVKYKKNIRAREN